MSTPFHHQLTKSYSNDIPISDVFEVFPLYTCYFLSVYLLVSCQYAWAATKMSDSTAGAATGERHQRLYVYDFYRRRVYAIGIFISWSDREASRKKERMCVMRPKMDGDSTNEKHQHLRHAILISSTHHLHTTHPGEAHVRIPNF